MSDASPRAVAWREFRRQPVAALSLAVFVALALACALAPLLAPYSFDGIDLSRVRQAPSLRHWMGTDDLGRDVLTRMLFGGRISLAIGVLAALLGTGLGTAIGAVSGYYGGALDNLLMRITDVAYAIPTLPLLIIVSSYSRAAVFSVISIIGLLSWMATARVVRSRVLTLREMDYVTAARAMGAGDLHILLRHVVPNALGPIVVGATLGIGSAILIESSLSFLGLGVQPPTPTWGNMLMDSLASKNTKPWLTLFPGLAILVTVLAVNFIGDALHDALDPEAALVSPVLEVRDLVTRLSTEHGVVRAVNGLSYTLEAGQVLALVGESGSGKSIAALSILGLVQEPWGRVASGSVRLDGRELVSLPDAELRRIRGRKIAMVFQDPTTSLNPVLTVGRQVAEGLREHLGMTSAAALARAAELLALVGIPDAKARVAAYPHELSGGQRQRVMIAMAIACEPAVLIADEPTTALDVTIQAQIVELVRRLQKTLGMAILWITHDLALAADVADRVAVIYAGAIVEEGPTGELLRRPRHPYTRGLLDAMPHAAGPRRLQPIPGAPPDLRRPWTGCAFASRCGQVVERCRQENPPLHATDSGTRSACWRWEAL